MAHVFNSGSVSGPETLVLPALRELGERAGLRPVVVFLTESRLGDAGREPVRYAQGLGLDVRVVEVKGRIDRTASGALAALLTALDPAIVHAHDVKASVYVLRAAKRAGVRGKLFSTHHGVGGRPDLKTRAYEALYTRLVLPRYDRVLAVSRADLADIARRGVDRPGQLQLLLNGVTRPLVNASAKAAVRESVLTREWGLDPEDTGAVILGIVARLSSEKRIDRALAVFAELRDIDMLPPWRVLIFGAGKLDGALRAQAERLRLESSVRWMGYRKTVGAETAGFDGLLSFSDAEGMPVSLLEAGWAGTPVFATGVGGIPDLIVNGESGVLVEPGLSSREMARALAAFVADRGLRERLGRNLQERVTRAHSAEAWTSRLAQFYREALDG
jgi:glycosyltransferase involved in cell wall biosynthesis